MDRTLITSLALTALIVSTPRALCAQPAPNTVLHRPWLEVAAGGAANSHQRLNRPPLCLDRSFPCLPADGPSRAGALEVAGYPSERFGLVGSIDLESHIVSVIGPAQRENVTYFFFGGRLATPLTHGQSLRTLRFFGDAMAGIGRRQISQRSDMLTSGVGAMVGGGVDWRLCKGLGGCMLRGDVSYRKFEASARDLDGWRTAVAMVWRLGTETQGAAMPSSASHRFEIGGGITMQTPPDVNLPPLCQTLALPCGSPRTFPDLGIAVSPAMHFGDLFSVAGEVSAFANLWYPATMTTGAFATRATTNHVRSTLAGPRLHSRAIHFGTSSANTMRLFGQVLAGEQWATEVPARRAVQPGLGVDVTTSRGLTVRWQFDYTRVPGPGRNLSGSRMLFGVVYGR
jgi:hypothetical protein